MKYYIFRGYALIWAMCGWPKSMNYLGPWLNRALQRIFGNKSLKPRNTYFQQNVLSTLEASVTSESGHRFFLTSPELSCTDYT